MWGRSKCEKCYNVLTWWELIPIAGYIINRGSCRHCGNPINRLYIMVEIVMGCITTALFYVHGPTLIFLKYLILITGLAAAWVSDSGTQLIPNKLNLTLFIGALPFILLGAINNPMVVLISLVIGILAPLTFELSGLLARAVTKNKDALPGGGDLLTLGVMGVYMGAGVLPAMLVVVVSSLAYIIITKQKGIPMGFHFFMGTSVIALLK